MKVDLVGLEKRYAEMSDEEFGRIEWRDLTEEACNLYAREFQRRKPGEWAAFSAQRSEPLRQTSLAESAVKESWLTTQGRLGRQGYIVRVVLINFLTLVAFYLIVETMGMAMWESVTSAAPLVWAATVLAGTVAGAFQTVKRLHDLDRPGTHFWLLLIPIIGLYIGLLLFFKKGTEGPNRFGNDPLS